MEVVVLMASMPRFDSLMNVSLPSIVSQTRPPERIVLVTDRVALSESDQSSIMTAVAPIPVTFLLNERCHGAAGSWNTGLAYINDCYPKSYVAILDDDDYWLKNHLELCLVHSRHGAASLVLSGISVIKDGLTLANNIPKNLKQSDFLVGNPGWQGSNTFALCQLFIAVGGFSDGLISSNDKDLAIRVLTIPNLKVEYTLATTVCWNLGVHSTALSARGSRQKLLGCAQFILLHGHRMTPPQKEQYFERISSLFAISEQAIINEINTNKDIRIASGTLASR
ncbi:glycosyltransferase [Shewanella sp. JBTF-M18]|uniref:Glycosyltransferase n=1 Tax=Shewanella insulae TaxID=2681496 RepID=A0A6L7I124_9GAMM|nr:glycosyltransferase family A protein [Shewanella insulae]MXR69960.1 glycosyltransferase [Shewanella insulae]